MPVIAPLVLGLLAARSISAGPAHAAGWVVKSPPGGIVHAVAVDPANPANVYAGASAGGVY